MRKSFTGAFLSAVIFILSVPYVSGQAIAEVIVSGAWARPTAVAMSDHMGMDMTADPASVSAAYLTIENLSDETLTFISASSPAAATVELHETRMDANDVMRMRPVENGIVIEPGEQAVFEPAGYHIMLRDLQNELVIGAAFSLTLTFENSSGESFDVVIGVPVLEDAPETSDILISDAWTPPQPLRTTAPNMSSIYMTLLNRGETTERIIEVQTDVAEAAKLSGSTITPDGEDMGSLTFNEIAELAIPAGESVTLQLAGDFIALVGLKQDMVIDDAILINLVFESGREQLIAVPVRDLFGTEAPHDDD